MNIAIINGSPKAVKSSSIHLAKTLEGLLKDTHNFTYLSTAKEKPTTELFEKIMQQDCIVFSFPLYVDSTPSTVISFLKSFEEHQESHPRQDIPVYTIVNCGFYEGHQSHIAMDIVKNWCYKVGFIFSGGIGIGGGPMTIVENIPLGKGPLKDIGMALMVLANAIEEKKMLEIQYVSPNFPRFLYLQAAHMGWNMKSKENGLSKKELYYF